MDINRIAQKFDGESFKKFDKQNIDELIVGSIGGTLRENNLVENCWLFVKFVIVFCHQTFGVY